ncbi:MAG: hypothetical protein IPI29_09905 [Ignavibacteria bacterium]|nr:hypothetical protein [Ignavibacteria bacterium]MBK7412853.1 hypothetical protein [Ignavibacteria bacterium]
MPALLLVSCTKHEVSVKELAGWVRDPSNGLVDSVEAGPYVLSMQYLPSRLLDAVAQARHRRANAQKGLSVFELAIRTTEADGADPVFSGISHLDEFTRRIQSLAFTIEQDVKLRLGSRTVDCLSAAFQQDVGLRTKRSVRLVFAASEEELVNSSNVIVEWSDREYATGRNLFECDLSKLADMPEVSSGSLGQ